MVSLVEGVILARGCPIALTLRGSPYGSELHGRVAHSAGRYLHVSFPELSLAQEKYLVNQIYSRPRAWLAWGRMRPTDHPFRSLAHILWLAMQGGAVVLLGFFTRRHPGTRQRSPALPRTPPTPSPP